MNNKRPDFSTLIPWVAEQPPYTKVNYLDRNNCVLAQWLKSQGFLNVVSGGTNVFYDAPGGRITEEIPQWVREGFLETFKDVSERERKKFGYAEFFIEFGRLKKFLTENAPLSRINYD